MPSPTSEDSPSIGLIDYKITPRMFSPDQIQSLILARPISDQTPWGSNDEREVEKFYRAVCAAVCRISNSKAQIEWDHYGSGYASFIDAWFYRPTSSSAVNISESDQSHTGLIVLLSRLSPYFVLMEGVKTWGQRGSSSYLPEAEMVDQLMTPCIIALGSEVQMVLESFGLVRLMAINLADPLPPKTKIDTNLASRAFTEFDALFYWMD